ncbi:MAG TPA: head GIN domain-containing protein [Rhodothermales bacterium]
MRAALPLFLAVLLSSCIVNIESDPDGHDDRRNRRRIYGNGDFGTEQRTLREFDAVSFNTMGTLHVTFGDAESIEIEADENLLRYFVTYVRDNTLQIGVENGVELDPDLPIEFHLTVRSIDALTIVGSGDVDMRGFDGERFALSVAGSGDARFVDFRASSLDVSIAGSGDLRIDGQVDDLKVSIAGSGNVRAANLSTLTTKISIAASGSVDVRVEDELDVTIAGSGSVRYYGNPAVSSTTVGSGRVVHAGD